MTLSGGKEQNKIKNKKTKLTKLKLASLKKIILKPAIIGCIGEVKRPI